MVGSRLQWPADVRSCSETEERPSLRERGRNVPELCLPSGVLGQVGLAGDEIGHLNAGRRVWLGFRLSS